MTVRCYDVGVTEESDLPGISVVTQYYKIYAASRASAVRATLPGLSTHQKRHLVRLSVVEATE